jgi:hypothetical protein
MAQEDKKRKADVLDAPLPSESGARNMANTLSHDQLVAIVASVAARDAGAQCCLKPRVCAHLLVPDVFFFAANFSPYEQK